MTLRRAVWSFLAAAGWWADSAGGQNANARLTMALNQTPLDRHHWGIAVLDPAGRLVFGRNADRLFMPASNTKLVVTARLRPMAAALRSRGINRIAGAIVGDGSAFDPILVHPTWENDDIVWDYGAPVSGLGFNENVVTVTLEPTTDGQPASLRGSPDLAEIVSRPVADWVFPTLNVSQNWIAEMLNKQLGRQFGLGGSWQEGIAVERRFLIDEVGLDSTQIMIHDGSGLSAKNVISPLVFARLLAFMRRDPECEAFAAGLPQSGMTGTLRNRFRQGPLEGRVRAKTGSIGPVNSLSGYLERERPSQDPCRTFSVQANHHTLGGRTITRGIDSVVVAIGDLGRCTSRRRVVYTMGNPTTKRP